MTRGHSEAIRPAPDLSCRNLGGWRAFARLAEQNLAAAREEIDALNVYPVRDCDTGTNMFLTVQAARAALPEAVGGDESSPDALSAFARGALLGARGSSGVILSQLFGALVRHLAEAESEMGSEAGAVSEPAPLLAAALVAATEAGYAAVGDPAEGTILSVARAASQAATAAATGATGTRNVGETLSAAAAAAREALARTPEQLAVLADAGVVDAGGRGLCVILEAAEMVVTGRRMADGPPILGTRTIPQPREPEADRLERGGPAYEVMYLLDADDPDGSAITTLRATLAPLGDSLVVVGGDGLWNVHVHVDDVGAAVEAGIAAGRPHRLRVTHFAEQRDRDRPHSRSGRAVVAVPAGPGLRRLFADAGAQPLPGADRAHSAPEILAALRATDAAEIVVLPNDRECAPAAQAAAQMLQDEEDGARVVVIETTTQVQGLAALAVHEPARPFDRDVLEMTAAARHTRSGAVTVATRRAITMAGPCAPGDVLGVVEGDFAVIGEDPFTVAAEVLDKLLGGGGELVTVLAGEGGEDGEILADRCAQYLADRHPSVDVVCYDGGQQRYPLLFGVE